MALAQRHKSFPNLTPTPNRLLAFKWDKTNYDGHRNRIQNIKSTVDTRSPPKVPQLTKNGRTGSRQVRIKNERQKQIEHENIMLLKKMVKISDKGGRVDNRNSNLYSKSLNSWKRNQELDRIERENISVLRRLALREPEYDHQLLEQKWICQDQLAEGIAKYPRRWWEYPKTRAPDLNRPNTGSHSFMKRQRSFSINSTSRPTTAPTDNSRETA